MSGTVIHAPAPPHGLIEALGLPLGAYRRDHVRACVARALRRESLGDLAALVARIETDPAVRSRLRRAIAVSTTGLFRDPTQLRWVDKSVMPALTAGAKRLRAWSAGCAAGEEAFTLAMMLEWHGMLGRFEVVGTDVLEESLAEAESGVVGGVRIPANMRGRVTWDQRELTTAAAPGEFQIVLCRNLMTFLTPVAADAVGRTLAASLTPGGVLVVARDEVILTPEALGLLEIAPSIYRRER